MISVIIPTRNRSKLLSVALQTALNQSLDSELYEIIVVDNGSDDNTRDVVKYYQTENKNITYVLEERPGLHNGRHTGMNTAKYNYLVFADDDIWARSSWLKGIADSFNNMDVKMIGGNNLPLFTQQPPAWLQCLWSWNMKLGYKSIPALSIIEFPYKKVKEISPYNVWGCNFAVSREIVESAGGFHPDGMPKNFIQFRGDGESHISDFVFKNQHKCVFVPEASVYHTVTANRMTHEYFYDQGYKEGVTSSYRMLRGAISHENLSLSKQLRNFIKKNVKLIANELLNRDVNAVLARYNKGIEFGRREHLDAYDNDSTVREWVHRSSYY